MNILRTIRKLRKMPLGETRGRIAERWRCRGERRAYRRKSLPAYGQGVVEAAAKQLATRAAGMVPGTRPSEVVALRSSYPEVYHRLRAQAEKRAEAILSGTCSLLGRKVDLTGNVDWHRDPGEEYRWKRDFYADLRVYQSSNGVDAKYVWELNRHQFLVELSRGWLFAGEDRCAARVRELLLDWIDENPQYGGVNWTSALEVAVRSVSWLWTLAAAAEWPGWRDDDWVRITHSLAEHATYIERHLSLYSSPYNHLMGEATALFLLGRWLHGLPGASKWERSGRRVLAEYGPRQFYRDGFCVEQATGYHFFTLGFLVQATAAARTAGTPLGELEPIVSKAFEAGAALKQPDGRWPAIGDLDSARSIPVYPDDFWDFRSFCSLGAVVCDLPQLKETAEHPGEELYWLLGVEGLRAWDKLRGERGSPGTVLPESGYVAASSGQGENADWLLLDAGPLAHGVHTDPTPSVAHGHADALQLLLFQHGRPVLVDSGMPFYAGERRWIDHFRGASAHNTLEVEGVPWARTPGRLEWSHVRGTPRLDANVSREVWLIRGRLSLGPQASLERNILGLPGRGVWIADLIRSDVPRRVRWYWQMPRAANPRQVNAGSLRSEIRFEEGVIATWTDAAGLDVSIDSALKENPAAWQAPIYGTLRHGFRISYETPPVAELLAVTSIGREVAPAAVTVRGRTLFCPTTGDIGVLPVPDSPAAEVIWQIRTQPGLSMFAGGVLRSSTEWQGQPLDGIGKWPAVRIDGRSQCESNHPRK